MESTEDKEVNRAVLFYTRFHFESPLAFLLHSFHLSNLNFISSQNSLAKKLFDQGSHGKLETSLYLLLDMKSYLSFLCFRLLL